jgi:hypothetical protein
MISFGINLNTLFTSLQPNIYILDNMLQHVLVAIIIVYSPFTNLSISNHTLGAVEMKQHTMQQDARGFDRRYIVDDSRVGWHKQHGRSAR